jgi:hypothetical protein
MIEVMVSGTFCMVLCMLAVMLVAPRAAAHALTGTNRARLAMNLGDYWEHTTTGVGMHRTSALVVAVGALCGAMVAPAGIASAETAQETISRLQSQGYTVNIDRVGSGPMENCMVTSVRNPQQVTQLVPYVGPGDRDHNALIPAVVSQTISVTLNCPNR